MSLLLNNEIVIIQSDDGRVTLSNKRIYKDDKGTGNSYYQSIMLEHVTSCENVYKSHIWLLVLSILSFAVGGYLCYMDNFRIGNNTVIALAVGLVFLVIYLLTRSHAILIASPSTKMYIKVTGLNNDRVRDFLKKVEQAIEDKR